MPNFVPSTTAVDKANEKSWAASLGALDWDTTRIVFTKRTLLEFLRYTGTTVDPNFSNISKLPRYGEFMLLSKEPAVSSPALTAADDASVFDEFKPSRRVRDPPGGKPTDIFGLNNPRLEPDALGQAPPKELEEAAESETFIETVTTATEDLSFEEPAPAVPASTLAPARALTPPEEELDAFKPTRKVRTVPGGTSTLAQMWGGDEEEEEVFKPTRKVRQRPGGHSNMDGIF